MKVLVTGATGFIGREVIRNIVKYNKNHSNKLNTTCIIRRKSNFLEKNKIRTILCDLNDKRKLIKQLKGFNVVVHLAGIVNTPSKKEFYNKNIEITRNLLEACKINKIKKFIFISTAVVISKVQGNYSKSKIEAEKDVKKSGLDYIILRPSLVYGEEDRKNIGGIIRLVKKYPLFPLIGGNSKMQPVYVGDVAQAIISSIKNTKISNKAYFIAGPRTITFRNTINRIAKALNKKCLLIAVPAFIPVLFVKIYERMAKNPLIVREQMERLVTDKIYDISEAKKDLNFKPQPFEKGVEKIILGGI